jgi:hypothetical protein
MKATILRPIDNNLAERTEVEITGELIDEINNLKAEIEKLKREVYKVKFF